MTWSVIWYTVSRPAPETGASLPGMEAHAPDACAFVTAEVATTSEGANFAPEASVASAPQRLVEATGGCTSLSRT